MKNKFGFEMATKDEIEVYAQIAHESFMNKKRREAIKKFDHDKKYTAGFAENLNK